MSDAAAREQALDVLRGALVDGQAHPEAWEALNLLAAEQERTRRWAERTNYLLTTDPEDWALDEVMLYLRDYDAFDSAEAKPAVTVASVHARARESAYYVYVLDCDHGVKVGITRDLHGRLADLERGYGHPFELLRWWSVASRQRAWLVEQSAHHLLADCRTTGEWFHCHPLEACDLVERVLRRGVPVTLFDRVAV